MCRRRRRPSTPARAALFQSGKVRHEAPGGDPACGCRRARGRRGRAPYSREARAAGPPHARRAGVAVEGSTELPEEGARVGLASPFGRHPVCCLSVWPYEMYRCPCGQFVVVWCPCEPVEAARRVGGSIGQLRSRFATPRTGARRSEPRQYLASAGVRVVGLIPVF